MHTPTDFAQSISFSLKYSLRSRNTSDPAVRPGKLMQQKFLLEIFFSHITHETKKNGTTTSVTRRVELQNNSTSLTCYSTLIAISSNHYKVVYDETFELLENPKLRYPRRGRTALLTFPQ